MGKAVEGDKYYEEPLMRSGPAVEKDNRLRDAQSLIHAMDGSSHMEQKNFLAVLALRYESWWSTCEDKNWNWDWDWVVGGSGRAADYSLLSIVLFE
ncbi:hypothetical protein ID866_762 [Astraeus odoratus]|nr:hypothetical protein ID866_762 [Astraeus odoratus]